MAGLTWLAGAAVLLERESGEAGTAVGAHGVEAQVLTEFPGQQQTLILVITRETVGQLRLCAQTQRLPAGHICL